MSDDSASKPDQTRVIGWGNDGCWSMSREEYEAKYGPLILVGGRMLNEEEEMSEEKAIYGPPAPERPKGFTVGRNVHYVHPRTRKHYAAIVAEVEETGIGYATLVIFDQDSRSTHYLDGIPYDPTAQRGATWHYIEAVID